MHLYLEWLATTNRKEEWVVLTYEKQALSGAIEVLSRSELPDEFEGTKLYGSPEEDELLNLKEQSYTALLKKMNCGRIAKFSDCRMKQGMDGSLFIMFFRVSSFTTTICT